MPSISVIVPVYQVENFLSRCVDSILAQTFSDFELILVDDGSTDRCPAICEDYARRDQRVHVLHQKNQGLSAARNAGINWVFQNNSSQWLSFVDSDDWVHPKYLETLYRGAKKLDLPIASCNWQRFEADSTEICPENFSVTALSPEEDYKSRNNDYDVASFAWRFLYHRDLFRKIRYPVGKHWEDLFTTYKLLFQCKAVAHTDAVLYYYFARPDSIARAPWNPQKLDMVDALLENRDFFRNSPWPELYQRLTRCCLVTIPRHMDGVKNSLLPEAEKACYMARLQALLDTINES
ncbi:MAG: glycosyltransferase [Negativibacillus sp.]